MELNELTLTNIVIEWLEKETYSKKHWQLVGQEMLEKSNADKDQAITLLAEALADFHDLYKKKVVNDNNLLHELLSHSFNKVKWRLVAKRFIKDS